MKGKTLRLPYLTPILLALCTVLITISGCKKSVNEEFEGTYAGALTLSAKGNTTPDTLIITAGTSANSIVIEEKVEGAIANATVSANSISIPSQTLPVKGGVYPLSGTGSLNGNTITLNLDEEISGVFLNSVFTGTKQK